LKINNLTTNITIRIKKVFDSFNIRSRAIAKDENIISKQEMGYGIEGITTLIRLDDTISMK